MPKEEASYKLLFKHLVVELLEDADATKAEFVLQKVKNYLWTHNLLQFTREKGFWKRYKRFLI